MFNIVDLPTAVKGTVFLLLLLLLYWGGLDAVDDCTARDVKDDSLQWLCGKI